jgi:AAA15 family ATPase/GTPase
MGTRPNQLFLTESIERGVKHFEIPYSWFDEILTFIFPYTRFEGLEFTIEEDKEFTNLLLKFLQLFNTGISDVVLKKVDIQSTLGDLPERIISDLLDDLEVGDKVVLSAPNDRRYLIHKDQINEIQVSKVMTKHKMFGCDDEALLEVAEESDGTQRLIDLIPALIQLLKMDRVFVVDELDRSLHPKLSHIILELFLNNKIQQKSQLIVTTHESSLLNLNLLRRDEIWFVEKDDRGVSSVYSLEEFTPRYDKDVRKGYLLGRFGAIPIVHSVTDLGWVD